MSEITQEEAFKANLKLSRRMLGLPQETTFEYLHRIVEQALSNGANLIKRFLKGQQTNQDATTQEDSQNKQSKLKTIKRYDFHQFYQAQQQFACEDHPQIQQALKIKGNLPSQDNIGDQNQIEKSSSAEKSIQSFYKSGRKRLKRDVSESSIYKSSKKPYTQKTKQQKEFEEKISFDYFCEYRQSLLEARKKQKQLLIEDQNSLKRKYDQYATKAASLSGLIDYSSASRSNERSPRILEIRKERQQRRNLRKKVQFEQENHHQLYDIDKVYDVLDQEVQRRKQQRRIQQQKKIRDEEERRRFQETERIRILQEQKRKEAAIIEQNRRRQQLQASKKAEQQRQQKLKQQKQKQERQKLNNDQQRQRQLVLSKQSSRNQLPPYDEQPNQESQYDDSQSNAQKQPELNSQQSSQVVQQPLLNKNSGASQNPPSALNISPSKTKNVDQKQAPKLPQKTNPFMSTPQSKALTLYDLIGTSNNNGDGLRSALPRQQNPSPQKSNIFKSPSGTVSNPFINGQQNIAQQFPAPQPSPNVMQIPQTSIYSNNQNIANTPFSNSFISNQPSSMNPLIGANSFNQQPQINSMIPSNPMNFLSSRGMNNNSLGLSTSTGSSQMGLGFGSMVQNNPPQFPSNNTSNQLNQMFPPNQMSLNTPGSSGSSANSFLSPQNIANPPRNYFLQSTAQNEPSLFSTNSNQNKGTNNNKKKGAVRIS